MTTLTITAKGQVTLRKEVLRHLGVKPGDKIELDFLPDGKASVSAAPPKRTGSIEDWFGMLGPWNGPPASLEDLNEAAAAGWASAMDYKTNDAETAVIENHPCFAGSAKPKTDDDGTKIRKRKKA